MAEHVLRGGKMRAILIPPDDQLDFLAERFEYCRRRMIQEREADQPGTSYARAITDALDTLRVNLVAMLNHDLKAVTPEWNPAEIVERHSAAQEALERLTRAVGLVTKVTVPVSWRCIAAVLVGDFFCLSGG